MKTSIHFLQSITRFLIDNFMVKRLILKPVPVSKFSQIKKYTIK